MRIAPTEGQGEGIYKGRKPIYPDGAVACHQYDAGEYDVPSIIHDIIPVWSERFFMETTTKKGTSSCEIRQMVLFGQQPVETSGQNRVKECQGAFYYPLGGPPRFSNRAIFCLIYDLVFGYFKKDFIWLSDQVRRLHSQNFSKIGPRYARRLNLWKSSAVTPG